MNERIRELAEQAKEFANYYAMLSDGVEQKIFTEKFAELIVQECAQKIEDMIDNGWYADTKELKKHFGVEEHVTESVELHTCPYAEEIHGDYWTLCDCDEERTRQCARDI